MQRGKTVGILDKSLSKGKNEVVQLAVPPLLTIVLQINLSTFALMFAEMIRYAQNKVNTVQELQDKYGYPESLLTAASFV